MITRKLFIILIVVPLGSIIVNTLFLYFAFDKQMLDSTPQSGYHVLVIALLVLAPTFALFIGFHRIHLNLSSFRKSDDETTVNEFRYITNFAYVGIIVSIIVTGVFLFIFYAIPWKNMLPQISSNWLILWIFLAVILPLLFAAYISLTTIRRPPDSRNEFEFHFARKSMMVFDRIVREDRKDEVKKFQFLMIALEWYNKFIKKNLKLEFDSAKICSSILSRVDKKQALDELVGSFEIDYKHKLDPNDMELLKTQDRKVYNLLKEQPDKLDPIIQVRIKPINDPLKPINCLSKIADLPSSESFLTQKKLTTTIKEMALIFGPIIPAIPVVITVLKLLSILK